jgi:Amt family ammonium transporter
LFYGGGLHLFGEQLLANAVTIVWSFGITLLIMLALKATMGVRVAEDVELNGLDLDQHAETAYHGAT